MFNYFNFEIYLSLRVRLGPSLRLPLTSEAGVPKCPQVYMLKYVLISIDKFNAALSTKITKAQFQPVCLENETHDALPVDEEL